jgi:hypothetical protein
MVHTPHAYVFLKNIYTFIVDNSGMAHQEGAKEQVDAKTRPGSTPVLKKMICTKKTTQGSIAS